MMKNLGRTQRVCAFILMLLLMPHSGFAQESTQELKQQIAELQAKVAQLEAAARQNPPGPPAAGVSRMNNQWDPFAEIDRMNAEMERMSSQFWQRSGMPQRQFFSNQMFLNKEQMTETKDGYQIKLDISGYDQDKVDIKAADRTLTISGEHKGEQTKESPNSKFESRSFGRFLNTMPLPEDADVSQMKTEKSGNQLIITLPKKK